MRRGKGFVETDFSRAVIPTTGKTVDEFFYIVRANPSPLTKREKNLAKPHPVDRTFPGAAKSPRNSEEAQ